MIMTVLLSLLLGSAAAADAPPITAAQADKILERVEQNGDSTVVPGYDLSQKLGLPTDMKDPYKTHYAARRFRTKEGDEHTFGRSKETGDFLVVLQTKSKIIYLRADKSFALVAGAFYKVKSGDKPEEIAAEEAGALLSTELALWAGRAGKK